MNLVNHMFKNSLLKYLIMMNYINYQKLIAHQAYKATCQFLKYEKGKIIAHGSGVFIQVDSQKFLISAAHVIDGYFDKIHVLISNKELLSLGGEITINNSGNRDNDKLDIAIIKLNEGTINNLGSTYHFIKKDELGINHTLVDELRYSSVGFPVTRTNYNPTSKEFKSESFLFLTIPANQSIYHELGCRLNINTLVRYSKKKVINLYNGKRVTSPDPFGISGSGLWYIPSISEKLNEEPPKKLVAILTEWSVENRKYWIATSIDVVTEMIRQQYGLQLEASRKVKL